MVRICERNTPVPSLKMAWKAVTLCPNKLTELISFGTLGAFSAVPRLSFTIVSDCSIFFHFRENIEAVGNGQLFIESADEHAAVPSSELASPNVAAKYHLRSTLPRQFR